MPAATTKCVFCQRPVDSKSGYRKVSGFERQRAQGGTNALALRAPTDEWACRWCIEKQQKGMAPAQGSLL